MQYLRGGSLSLTERTAAAKIYVGQIFAYGEFEDPRDFSGQNTITIDEAFVDAIIGNFNAGTLGAPIQVPFGSHDRDLRASAGVVQRLERRPGGLWAYLRITDSEAVERIELGEAAALSPGWEFDFISTSIINGKRTSHGPTLIHVAVVDVPHFAELENLVAASKRVGRRSLSSLTEAQIRQVSADTGMAAERVRQLAAKYPNPKPFPTSTPAAAKMTEAEIEQAAKDSGLSVEQVRKINQTAPPIRGLDKEGNIIP